jgi:hypothetical protein
MALVLMIVGLIGLAPSFLNLFRRRRLLSHLANLKVDEDAAHALFSPVLAAGSGERERMGEPADLPEQEADEYMKAPIGASLERVADPTLTSPSPALHAALEMGNSGPALVSLATPGVSRPQKQSPAGEVLPTVENRGIEASVEDVDELDVDSDAVDAEEEEEEQEDDKEEAADDEDDLMAMFKDTKVVSSAPAVLTEDLEPVSAVDLLAQARELRDLLRRAA